METHETIKEIKKQFRLFMNGVVSQSMREKGLDYKHKKFLVILEL